MSYIKYRLDIYHEKIIQYLLKYRNIKDFLDSQFVKKYFGMTHQEMVESGWINDQWITFLDWYNRGWLSKYFGGSSVFRGISSHSWGKLRRIIQNGTDRVNRNEYAVKYGQKAVTAPQKIYRGWSLTEDQWFWATESFNIAWLFALNDKWKGEKTNILVLSYNKSLLKKLRFKEYWGRPYTLRKGIENFQQTLQAVIYVRIKP